MQLKRPFALNFNAGGDGYLTSETFSQLNASYPPSSYDGYLAFVETTTGAWNPLTTTKEAGWYRSNGTTWVETTSDIDIELWKSTRTYTATERVIGSDGILYTAESTTSGINPVTDDGSTWSSGVDFNILQSAILMKEGRVAWDSESGTIQVGLPGGNVKLQVGQEMHLPNRPKNIEGAQINNGQVVWGDSATGSVPEVKLAIASDPNSARGSIALATENVADQQRGYYTTNGVVRDFDTSHLTVGLPAYLDPTIKGALTNTRPTAPNVPIIVGICLRSHATEGEFFVKISVDEYSFQSDITMEPTGFQSPENVIVTYDSTTRKVTLTGTVVAYYKGKQVEVLTSGWTSDVHDATNGPWFLFYNGTTFVWQQTPWAFNTVQIAFVYYGTSNKFALRECHGLMQWQGHEEAHETIGTYKQSGGTLSNYTLGSTTLKKPNVSSTVVKDEDILTTNPALTGGLYTICYLTGSGELTFNTGYPSIVFESLNQPYYNLFSGGTWAPSPVSNNDYMNVWVIANPATADSTSQAYRYLFLMGQNQFATLSGARGETLNDLTLGNLQALFTEFVFINKITLKYTAGNWSITEVNDLSGTRLSQSSAPSGNFLSVVETDTTLVGNGTVADPLGVNPANPTIKQETDTVLSTGWSLVGGLYEYTIVSTSVTSTSVVDVIPDNADIEIVKAAEILPQTDSFAAAVKIYAKNMPTTDIGVTLNISKGE